MNPTKLTKSERRQERMLLDYLVANQGAAISVLNVGRANNATTYRGEFCDASSELFRLYRIAGVKDPLSRMLERFKELRIETCRQNEFNEQNIKYLYTNFIAARLRTPKFITLAKLAANKPTKTTCTQQAPDNRGKTNA